MTLSYIGVGANIGAPRAAIDRAIALLGAGEDAVVAVAPYYGSRPLGPPDQPDYVNTVVALDARSGPVGLLQRCKAIERCLGRKTVVRWGPRVIDLDLLLYGDLQLTEPALTLPHPELHRRRFVLHPLADLAPDLIVPGLARTVRELADSLTCDPGAIWPLAGHG